MFYIPNNKYNFKLKNAANSLNDTLSPSIIRLTCDSSDLNANQTNKNDKKQIRHLSICSLESNDLLTIDKMANTSKSATSSTSNYFFQGSSFILSSASSSANSQPTSISSPSHNNNNDNNNINKSKEYYQKVEDLVETDV